MEQSNLFGSFEHRKILENDRDPNQASKIYYRFRSTDSNGMLVFHRYLISNNLCLSFADEETKVNFMRLSLMPEFPEITVKHFSIYYQPYDKDLQNIEEYIESFSENEKLGKIFEILEKLIELIIKIHELKICLLQLKTHKIFVVDGKLKLYFPVELHRSRDDFKRNDSDKIEPMNGYEKDVMDFALIIIRVLGGDIKKYKRIDKTMIYGIIQSLKENDIRKNNLRDLAYQILIQEINYNQLTEIKELILKNKL